MELAHERTAAALFTLLLCCSLVAGILVGSAGAQTRGLSDVESEAFEADRAIFIVTVYGNGSAEWTFRYEQQLESDTAVSDFEVFAEQFNTEETDTYRNFRTRATRLAAAGENTTSRPMAAGTFSRNARVEERPLDGEEFGIVEMSFVWEGFAERDGGRTVVGDVFEGGLYVGPDQQLRFERGSDVRFESVDPEPDSVSAGTLAESESVTWASEGERQFTDRRPRIVYVDQDATPTTTDTDTPETTVPETDASADGGFPLWAVVLALLATIGIGGGLAYRSRSPSEGGSAAAQRTTGDTGGTASPSDVRPDADTASETAQAPAVSEEELLSDEERVVTLLDEHGGRMKQVDIVENTDWSKSKVSMLLSEMEDDGTISKLRVGRENIVSLAGHEPDAAGSPFDDEGE